MFALMYVCMYVYMNIRNMAAAHISDKTAMKI